MSTSDGEYEYNLCEDWLRFVESVRATMEHISDEGADSLGYELLIAFHTGGELDDVQRAMEQVRAEHV